MNGGHSVRRARFHRGYVVAGLAACALYLALPSSHAAQALFVVVAVTTPLVSVIVLLRQRSPERFGWWLLTAGFGVAAIGEIIDFFFVTLAWSPGLEPEINVIFLAAYIIELWGLMSVFHARSESSRQLGWFDAVVVGIGVFTIVWSTMYEAIFGSGRASPLDLLTRFGGAVLDVALVVTALRLVIGRRGRRTGAGLLLAAFVLQMAGDDIAALWDGYRPGQWVDTLWALSYVLVAAAVTHPGRDTERRAAPTRAAHREIRDTLVMQACVMGVLAVMVVVQIGSSVPAVTLVVWGVAWLALLMVTRMRVYGLLKMVEQASATESQRRLTAMVASSDDVIGLADPDGTISYLSPSIERLTGVPASEWIGQRFDIALSRHVTGLDDFLIRSAHLAAGQQATWECTAKPHGDDVARTMRLTLANELETPEVNGWVITAHDVTDQARLTSELRHQSLHDTLTGLPNRGLLFDRIQHSLDRMSRAADARIAVVLVDIDDFKAVNDSLGHTTGDELLRAVADRLASAVRQGDTVARLGGDEFALLLEDTDEHDAMILANRALESLALPVHIATGDFAVRASAGVVCHRGGSDPVELLRSADIAMYASKRDGKSKVTLFQEHMHMAAREQLELRMDLSTALERDEFVLVYQPIVDTHTQRICGVEALLRWVHPERGMVSPADFIPIAEQSGYIRSIGAWVLETACTEAATWDVSHNTSYISVNVSAPQLTDPRFIDIVLDVLERTSLPPRRLLLEITESMLIDDSDHASAVLARLREMGIRIAIDDFGTGYSSLSYLRQLCVDVVKIDQSFVRDLGSNADHQALTRTILALAEGLDMTAIAEGVETDCEYAELSRLGCSYVQGYLFSRPVSADALHELFHDQARASDELEWSSPPG
jgi:diguanylate cyclase (GGDEF)-like protein/PAS domain S-box-containing protein